jgi:Ca2+-binding EF-hand superfamily protein
MKPIPEGTVKVYFNVFALEDGEYDLEFNFENELLKHRENVTMRKNMYESWINNVLERKLKVKTEVHLGTEFESTRFVGLDGKPIDPFVPSFDISKVTNLQSEKKSSQKINVDSPRFISTLKRSLEEMFNVMDKDATGLLTYDEFKDSFRTLSYGLNDNDINMLIALADENEDERIDWKEFIPIGLDAIRTFYTRNLQKAAADEMKSADPDQLKKVYWDEISKTSSLLNYKFKDVDTIEDGMISLQHFKNIIRGTKGLTPKEKNLLIRLQKNDMIKYSEFPEMLYNVRYEIAMSETMDYNIDNVSYDLRKDFACFDYYDSKIITVHECQIALQKCKKLNLTPFQIHILLGLSDCDADGQVPYIQFVDVCVEYIRSNF